jgi:Xaa-Pro aminopeptidase
MAINSEFTLPSFYRDTLTPPEEINRRILSFQKLLSKEGIEGALIYQNVDLYYFTGTLQNGFLFLPSEGEPLLLIKKEFQRAQAESPLERVEWLPSITDLGERIRRCGLRIPACLGLELDVLPFSTFQFLKDILKFEQSRDVWPLIRSLRETKSVYELGLLKRAGEIGEKIYQEIGEHIRPGSSEIEIAGRLNYLAMRQGHQNILRSRGFNSEIYTWHVVSGRLGTLPSNIDAPFSGLGLSPAFPLGASLKPIQEKEPVLIDFGTCYTGYQVDQTRMYCIGKPGHEYLEAYEALKEIEAHLLQHLRPGVPAESLFPLALAKGGELGFEAVFLGPPERKVRYVGHGVGLESPETPFLAPGHSYPLREGMTLALELKIVLEKGAVGFENTVVVTKNGPEKLTPASEELVII